MKSIEINIRNTFLILLGFLAFWSCKKKSHLAEEEKTLRYNEFYSIEHLHPLQVGNEAERRVVHQIYNGLWRLGNDGNLYPSLADSTSQIDSLTWEFVLKPDIQLHSTLKPTFLTSDDVIFSLKSWAKSQNKTTETIIFKHLVGKDTDKAFEKISKIKFRIHLTQAFSSFLHLLTTTPALISPNWSSRFASPFSPVGSGAFYVKEYRESEMMLLERHEAYFKNSPFKQSYPLLDEIKISFLKDEERLFDNFDNKNLDWIASQNQTIAYLQSQRASKEQQLDSFPLLSTVGFEINYLDSSASNPLTTLSFRQALNMSLDRGKFERILGFGKPAHNGIFPDYLPKSEPSEKNGYNFHPLESKEILRKIGYDSTHILKVFALSSDTAWVNLATRQWKKVGISTVYSSSKNEADLIATKWKSPYAEESALFWKYYQTDLDSIYIFKKSNYDSLFLLSLGKNSFKPNKKLIYRNLNAQIIRNAPFLEIFHEQQYVLRQQNIIGLAPNMLGIYYLDEVDKQNLSSEKLSREEQLYE